MYLRPWRIGLQWKQAEKVLYMEYKEVKESVLGETKMMMGLGLKG